MHVFLLSILLFETSVIFPLGISAEIQTNFSSINLESKWMQENSELNAPVIIAGGRTCQR